MEPSYASLLAQARAEDYERYLIALLLGSSQQTHLWPLICLNAELARIPEKVSQEMVGFIRMAWWRERLDEAYAGRQPASHAIVQGLHRFIAECSPPRDWFDALITARQEQIGRCQFDDRAAWKACADGTSGMLAALMSYAMTGDAVRAEQARLIGTAYGMLGLIRASAHALAHQGISLLPGIAPEWNDVSPAGRAELASVVRTLRGEAQALLAEALPPDASSALLHRLSLRWARRLAAEGDWPFSAKVQQTMPFLSPWLLLQRFLIKC